MTTAASTARIDTSGSLDALTETTCGCGQALEWYHSSHCPRCGVDLRTDASSPVPSLPVGS